MSNNYAETNDYGLFRANPGRCPTWPNSDELSDWMANESPGGRDNSTKPALAQWALDAAISRISERTLLPVQPVNWAAGVRYRPGFVVFALVPVGTATAGTVGSMARWSRKATGAVSGAAFDAAEEEAWTFLELAEVEPIPHEVFLATLMQANIWYRRWMTPDGATLGANELGGIVRQARVDSSVEQLIANHIVYGLA